jgi:hypothetical protein
VNRTSRRIAAAAFVAATVTTGVTACGDTHAQDATAHGQRAHAAVGRTYQPASPDAVERRSQHHAPVSADTAERQGRGSAATSADAAERRAR